MMYIISVLTFFTEDRRLGTTVCAKNEILASGISEFVITAYKVHTTHHQNKSTFDSVTVTSHHTTDGIHTNTPEHRRNLPFTIGDSTAVWLITQ